MKIKVQPYPNLKVEPKAFEKVTNEAVIAKSAKPLSTKLLMLAEFKTREKRLLHAHPIKHHNKTYISVFPNPVHLFLNSAIEHFEYSEQIKSTNFPKCGKQVGEDIYHLDAEEGGTHACYNSYLQNRCGAVIMLVSSVEAFLNHIVPNDFLYKTMRGKNTKTFNKIDIESTKVNFNEKLGDVIKQYLHSINSNADLEKEIKLISNLNKIRNSIIHLKTNAENDISVYIDDFEKMLGLDLQKCIQTVISYMNKVEPEFIKIQI